MFNGSNHDLERDTTYNLSTDEGRRQFVANYLRSQGISVAGDNTLSPFTNIVATAYMQGKREGMAMSHNQGGKSEEVEKFRVQLREVNDRASLNAKVASAALEALNDLVQE